MKFCSVVVTYYPSRDAAAENILQYIEHTDHLIIWENTPEAEREAYRISLPQYARKITFMGTGENVGIAFALNRAAEWAAENGYTHLMMMDQDSRWTNFKLYRDRIAAWPDDDRNVALFAPSIINARTGLRESYVSGIMTSGSVAPLWVFDRIGRGFNEDYFIDCVDLEFYYCLLAHGLTYAIVDDAVMVHSLGYRKKVKFFNFHTENYSAFRLYYITRNGLWLWRDYRRLGVLSKTWTLWRIVKRIVRNCRKIILAESSKGTKLKAIARGFADGCSKSHKPLM